MLVFQWSCTESLPPREDPAIRFLPSLSATYYLTPRSNGLSVWCWLRNTYDETLQGRLAFDGKVEIIWQTDPSVKKVDRLTPTNLGYARNYNSQTRILTLDPGDSVGITYTWSIMDDSEADLRSRIFELRPDMGCLEGGVPIRWIADTESFWITGSMMLFEGVGFTTLGFTQTSFCLVSDYISPRQCSPTPIWPPCGLAE